VDQLFATLVEAAPTSRNTSETKHFELAASVAYHADHSNRVLVVRAEEAAKNWARHLVGLGRVIPYGFFFLCRFDLGVHFGLGVGLDA